MKDLLSSVAAEACLDKHGGFEALVAHRARAGGSSFVPRSRLRIEDPSPLTGRRRTR